MQRLVRIVLELGQGVLELDRILVDEPLSEAQPDFERHQLLLRPIMNVAFESAARLVLGAHQPLARGAQVLEAGQQVRRQPRIAKHQAGLGGEVGDQLGVGRRERLIALADGERTQHLALVAHRDRQVNRGERGHPVILDGDHCRRQRRAFRPPGRGPKLLADL